MNAFWARVLSNGSTAMTERRGSRKLATQLKVLKVQVKQASAEMACVLLCKWRRTIWCKKPVPLFHTGCASCQGTDMNIVQCVESWVKVHQYIDTMHTYSSLIYCIYSNRDILPLKTDQWSRTHYSVCHQLMLILSTSNYRYSQREALCDLLSNCCTWGASGITHVIDYKSKQKPIVWLDRVICISGYIYAGTHNICFLANLAMAGEHIARQPFDICSTYRRILEDKEVRMDDPPVLLSLHCFVNTIWMDPEIRYHLLWQQYVHLQNWLSTQAVCQVQLAVRLVLMLPLQLEQCSNSCKRFMTVLRPSKPIHQIS